jgi:hypothetical protein
LGEELRFTSQGYDIAISRMRETARGVCAEISITREALGSLGIVHFHWGSIDLASISGREALAKKLKREAGDSLNWGVVLERVCRDAVQTFRRGAPIVALEPVPRAAGAKYLVEQLLPLGVTTTFFGDGDSGKSMLATTIALAVATGKTFQGIRPLRQAPVLYLDWEYAREAHEERLHGLTVGLGAPFDPGTILYRPMTRALADDVAALSTEVARLGVGLVIIDSLTPASRSQAEESWHGEAIAAFNALRSLDPVSRLVIAHTSKADADQKTGRVFGSVFVRNPQPLALRVGSPTRREGRPGDGPAYHGPLPSQEQRGPPLPAPGVAVRVPRRRDYAARLRPQ